MTVETYLRAQVPGYPFEMAVLEHAALSPVFATPEPLRAVSVQDEVEDFAYDEGFIKSLRYATSTLLYSAAGVFSGGSRSEQVGDVRASLSGFIITQSDREYFRAMADRIRKQLGADIEEDVSEGNGMFDASCLRNIKPGDEWTC